jgi:hypothetical protein
MGGGFEFEYKPIAANAEIYKAIYNKYCELGAAVEGLKN